MSERILSPMLIGALLFVCAAAACATDNGAERAGRAVALSWQTILEARTTLSNAPEGGPTTDAREATSQAEARFERVEGVVRIWQESGAGETGWRTLAPCLSAALGDMERTFRTAELEVPADLDQAQSMTNVGPRNACTEDWD